MSQGFSQRASEEVYRGIWGVMSRLFRVPRTPPELPHRPGEFYRSFKPSRGFLNYLRFQFAWGLVIAGLLLIAGVGGITSTAWFLGVLSGPVALLLEVVAAVLGFIAIHLRYDTTWYVLNERSMRLRRGIFIIRETTITFENIQNVSVKQGPLQRWFRISNIIVETAGGGNAAEGADAGGHAGLIEGVEDAQAIRDMIMARMARSKLAGLGDDEAPAAVRGGLSLPQLERLREIRDLIQSL